MLSFIGIGAQKAGTTWLYEMLRQHPEIHFPNQKELHFWNRDYNGHNEASYFKLFSHPTNIEGEITPAYGHLPPNTIKRIHNQYPALKLIYIIRNPIQRAWSSALMAMKRSELEFDEVSNQWFIDHFNSRGSLQRGDYESCLKNWLNIFDRKQLLILMYEDIGKHPETTLNRCCLHLQAEPFSKKLMGDMNIEKKVFSSGNHRLTPTLKRELLNIYSEKIKSLECYLDTNLQHWLK